jgi:hypothetical protein
VFTPRDALTATDAGANGNYTLDFNPLDEDVVYVREEFPNRNTSSYSNSQGSVLGWSWATGGAGTSAITAQTGVFPYIGIHRLRAGSATPSAGTFLAISLGDGAVLSFGALGSNAAWDSKWVFRLNSTADVRLRLGFCSDLSLPPTNGFWMRYDTVLSDTNFTFETNAASSSTVSSGVVADTGWHLLRIRSTSAGTILFQVDAAAEQSLATNVPTDSLVPCAQVATNTTAEKNVDLDLFAFKARVTR